MLKSNCDTPIDVWLVSGHHQQKHQEDEEVPHAGMAAVHVKHEGDPMAGVMHYPLSISNLVTVCYFFIETSARRTVTSVESTLAILEMVNWVLLSIPIAHTQHSRRTLSTDIIVLFALVSMKQNSSQKFWHVFMTQKAPYCTGIVWP